MDRHINKLTTCWPCEDHSHLHPAAHQSSKVHEAVKDAEDVSVTLPNYGHDCKPLRDSGSLNVVMDAAPKYQHGINGPRFRSNGEINTSARKHPKNRREGGQKRLAKDKPMPQMITKRRKTIDGDMCSYHTNHKHCIKKELKPSMFAVIDPQATGSIYTGDSKYILNKHSTTGPMVTVTVAAKSGKLSCPLVTLACVAKTWAGEKVVCLHHNVAHVRDDSCHSLVLSGMRMKDSGVTVTIADIVGGEQNPRELDVVSVDDVGLAVSMVKRKTDDKNGLPCIELFLHDNSVQKLVTLTANTPWCPSDVPETRGCSVCGERDCRRPRCIKLNSFGLSVTATGDLQPGDHKVFHT